MHNNDNDNNDDDHYKSSFTRIKPLSYEDVEKTIINLKTKERNSKKEKGADSNSNSLGISTLLLELPHRELGGKGTSYKDILKMKQLCVQNNIKFHCDGARIFESTTGYNEEHVRILQEISEPFDSLYISFYKGLEGISGAMLLGNKNFCNEARIWLRRYGGNLYTLLPYAVSGWVGYKKHWLLLPMMDDKDDSIKTDNGNNIHRNNMDIMISFQDKKKKLVRLVEQLSSLSLKYSNLPKRDSLSTDATTDTSTPSTTCSDCPSADNASSIISSSSSSSSSFTTKKIPKNDSKKLILCFDPEIPETNMVHGYLLLSIEECNRGIEYVKQKHGIEILFRIKPVDKKTNPYACNAGYKSKFEWTIGAANYDIDDELFIKGWNEFLKFNESLSTYSSKNKE